MIWVYPLKNLKLKKLKLPICTSGKIPGQKYVGKGIMSENEAFFIHVPKLKTNLPVDEICLNIKETV